MFTERWFWLPLFATVLMTSVACGKGEPSSGSSSASSATSTIETVTCNESRTWGDPNPTASPEVHATIDVSALSVTEAPAGMAPVLRCDCHDAWRALSKELTRLLTNLERTPIEHGLPPSIRLAIFADPDAERRQAVLAPDEANPTTYPDGAAGLVAREVSGELSTDGTIVWGDATNGELDGQVWGAYGGVWKYGLFASDDELFAMVLDAAATAASISCSR